MLKIEGQQERDLADMFNEGHHLPRPGLLQVSRARIYTQDSPYPQPTRTDRPGPLPTRALAFVLL